MKNYTVLAESERGPQIVEHRNTLAVQFHISSKYLETVKALENFIKYKILEIQKVERMHITLNQADLNQRRNKFQLSQNTNETLSKIGSQGKIQAEKEDTKVLFTKDFKFSGNNYSRRRKFVVVDNNAINSDQIRPSTTAKDSHRSLGKTTEKKTHKETDGFDFQNDSELVLTNGDGFMTERGLGFEFKPPSSAAGF